MNVLGMIQLVDSPGACGGYPFCFGIERRVTVGELRSPADILSLAQRLLASFIGPCDGIAAACAFKATRGGDWQTVGDLCRQVSAGSPPALRLASAQMGRRLWELSRRWDWAIGVHSQLDPLAATIELHHAVVFGSLVSETTANPVRAAAACLLQAARGIINSAIATGGFDEAIGRSLICELQPAISDIARQCALREAHDIGPIGDISDLGPTL